MAIIQNLFKLRKGDIARFNKKAYIWHKNHRAQKNNSNLKQFPEWDLVKDLEFNVINVRSRKTPIYRGGIAIIILLEDDTICKGLSHIIHKTGTTWVLHNDWKNGQSPYIFFRRI